MVSPFKLFLTAVMIAGFNGLPAQAGEYKPSAEIKVRLNNAKVLKLSRPATTVIIGNPEIADVTIQDSETLVLNGRGFGRTNLVILDATGTPILDEQIAVGRDTASIVRVYRGAVIENLSCEPECESAYLTDAERDSVEAAREANRR